MDFTNPKEIISRVKPGYFTDFNAFFTCSSEIDIFEGNLPASDVNCCQDRSPCSQGDGIAEGQAFQCFLSEENSRRRAAVFNALRTTRSTCLPILVIRVIWTAPT